MPSPPALLTLAKDFVDTLLSTHDYTSYDVPILHSMRLISATLTPNPAVTTRLTVTLPMCNALRNLHGGATATIFDLCTTLPIALLRRTSTMTEEEEEHEDEAERGIFWLAAGVSRTLNVAYLEGVEAGEEIEVVGEVVKIGKRLAHLRGEMRRVRDGVLVAVAEHGKVNIDPPSPSSLRPRPTSLRERRTGTRGESGSGKDGGGRGGGREGRSKL